jgi:ABC-2 type transport system ATP-binding protein
VTVDPAIRVRQMSKRYGEVLAVRDASFEVERGGSSDHRPKWFGKTTTVECLQGLRIPDGGDLSVLGLDPRVQGTALRHRIGSQLQESALPTEFASGRRWTFLGRCRPGRGLGVAHAGVGYLR